MRFSSHEKMAVMEALAFDTCPGMICSSRSMQHQSHKSLWKPKVPMGCGSDWITTPHGTWVMSSFQAALIRNALACIFQQSCSWLADELQNKGSSLNQEEAKCQWECIILWFLRKPLVCTALKTTNGHSNGCSITSHSVVSFLKTYCSSAYYASKK